MLYCKNPYISCEINCGGDVFPCCNDWCSSYSFGNVLEQSIEEIWFGEKAQNFRKQFAEKNYPYCQMDKCLYNMEQSEDDMLPEVNLPKVLRLVYDRSCNLQCKFCRSQPITTEDDDAEKINEVVKSFLPKMNITGGIIYLCGAGEVFSSRLALDIIKDVATNYENVKFHIITNGVLASEEKFKSLNLENKVRFLEVSVHAMTEKTYNKLIKGGNFKKLRTNIEYMANLLREKKIEKLFMNYTITSENFHEMKDFVIWAKKMDALISFLPLVKNKSLELDVFNELNISNPSHPKYHKFYKVMQDSIFKSDNIVISSEYFNLPKPKNFLKRIFC